MRFRWLLLPLLFLVPTALGSGGGAAPHVAIEYAPPPPTTLHFHFEGGDMFWFHPQAPPDEVTEPLTTGLATHSNTCLGNPYGLGSAHHVAVGFPLGGRIGYVDGEMLRGHDDGRIAYDVGLDLAQPAIVHWYLETRPAPGTSTEALRSAPWVVPNVVVQATLQAGTPREAGVETKEGSILAQGRVGPAHLHPSTRDVPHHEVEGRHVYEFAVPLSFSTERLLSAAPFFLRIETFLENPVCAQPPERYLMPNLVEAHTSPGLRPRMVLPIGEPVRIESMEGRFVGSDFVVFARVNTPWGEGPLDSPDALRLSMEGPSDVKGLERAAFVQPVYDPHDRPQGLEAVWLWPYVQAGAQPGRYAVRLDVRTDQGAAASGALTMALGADACTAEAVCEPAASASVPAPPALAALAVLAVFALRARSAPRRRAGRTGRADHCIHARPGTCNETPSTE